MAASRGSVKNAVCLQTAGDSFFKEGVANGGIQRRETKNEPFLLSEHSIFGGHGTLRDREMFRMRFLPGLKGTLESAIRLFHR